MASLTTEQRMTLLRALRFQAGQAEQTPPTNIFPVPENIRALEPEPGPLAALARYTVERTH